MTTDEAVAWLRRELPQIRLHHAVAIADWPSEKLEALRLLIGNQDAWFDIFFNRIVTASSWPSAEVMKNFPDRFTATALTLVATGQIGNANAELLMQLPGDEQEELLDKAKVEAPIDFEQTVNLWVASSKEVRRLLVALRTLRMYAAYGEAEDEEETKEVESSAQAIRYFLLKQL